MLVDDLFGSRMYLEVAVKRFAARGMSTTRAKATARLCNTLKSEISADRQLPRPEQINTVSPGAFFPSKREQALLLREVREEKNISLNRSRICLCLV